MVYTNWSPIFSKRHYSWYQKDSVFIEDAAAENKYTELKKQIIMQFSKTEEKKKELGDQKPSQLLVKMCCLA